MQINGNHNKQKGPPPPPPPQPSIDPPPPPKMQSKIEKITAMLVSQNLMGSNEVTADKPVTNESHHNNRVTINYLNGEGNSSNNVRNAMPNGILKNGLASTTTAAIPSSEQKNISFGKMQVFTYIKIKNFES